jgi:hypothetical protein
MNKVRDGIPDDPNEWIAICCARDKLQERRRPSGTDCERSKISGVGTEACTKRGASKGIESKVIDHVEED